MNRRIARKILRDPIRHSAHHILQAARRVRPVWFRPGENASLAAYSARSILGRDRDCPAERRLYRWYCRRLVDRHDWAWREVALPF